MADPRPIADLRSDTVTKPTPAMREAMARADVGDDVLGDDPTVQRLERTFATLMGKPAACFVPSGTMANQCALAAHTRPGDEIIAHEGSHIIHYEGGGPAVISGCMVLGLPGHRGLISAQQVLGAIRPDNSHYPRSRLLVLENTHNRGGGSVWPLDQLAAVTRAARDAGLATHLDGARIWNACAVLGTSPATIASHFDTISACFSKGLGAPVGSALAGDEATIARARRVRKMLGGGMRQSGILAAACLFALEHHRARLSDDHARAQRLARAVAQHDDLMLSPQHAPSPDLPPSPVGVQTNVVLIGVRDGVPADARQVCDALRTQGVLMLPTGPRTLRAVTNLEVDDARLDHAIAAITAMPWRGG